MTNRLIIGALASAIAVSGTTTAFGTAENKNEKSNNTTVCIPKEYKQSQIDNARKKLEQTETDFETAKRELENKLKNLEKAKEQSNWHLMLNNKQIQSLPKLRKLTMI